MTKTTINPAKSSTWLMLVIRLLLFGLIQTAIALFLGLFGTFNAFSASTK